jgi:hypothetical protein
MDELSHADAPKSRSQAATQSMLNQLAEADGETTAWRLIEFGLSLILGEQVSMPGSHRAGGRRPLKT